MANRLKYNDLSYQIKKYVQFAITEHCAELPLLPILPVKLSSLIRFAWWCQWVNVKGGMNSIRNYVSAVVEFGLSYGFADPRLQEPWVYQKFRREGGKYIEVYEGTDNQVTTRRLCTKEFFLPLIMRAYMMNLMSMRQERLLGSSTPSLSNIVYGHKANRFLVPSFYDHGYSCTKITKGGDP